MENTLNRYLVLTPEFCVGEVMGELNTRMGTLESLYQCEKEFVVGATVSKANMHQFEQWLESTSRGQGKLFSAVEAKDA